MNRRDCVSWIFLSFSLCGLQNKFFVANIQRARDKWIFLCVWWLVCLPFVKITENNKEWRKKRDRKQQERKRRRTACTKNKICFFFIYFEENRNQTKRKKNKKNEANKTRKKCVRVWCNDRIWIYECMVDKHSHRHTRQQRLSIHCVLSYFLRSACRDHVFFASIVKWVLSEFAHLRLISPNFEFGVLVLRGLS